MSTQGALGVVHVPKTGGAALRVALGGVPGCYVSPFYADASLIDGVDVDGLPGTTRRQFASADALRHICQENRLVIGHYSADILLESGCDHSCHPAPGTEGSVAEPVSVLAVATRRRHRRLGTMG